MNQFRNIMESTVWALRDSFIEWNTAERLPCNVLQRVEVASKLVGSATVTQNPLSWADPNRLFHEKETHTRRLCWYFGLFSLHQLWIETVLLPVYPFPANEVAPKHNQPLILSLDLLFSPCSTSNISQIIPTETTRWFWFPAKII